MMISCSPKSEDELYLNHLASFNSFGSVIYFTVVTVKNINTKKVKEICISSNFLSGALHIEYNIEHSESGYKKLKKIISKNRDRYFEFSNENALRNISWYEYDLDKFEMIKRTTNIDSLAIAIKKDKRLELGRCDRIEYRMYAHLLFNKGILTKFNSCLTNGNLYYADRSKIPN